MPRYFFHVRGPGHWIPDALGEDLADLTAARDAVADLAGDLTRHALRGEWSGWTFEVVDESGETVLTCPISDSATRAARR